MYCQNCGNQINNDVPFCPFCGVGTLNKQVFNNTPTSNNTVKKKKRSRVNPFIIVIVILLLIFPVKDGIERAFVKSAVEKKMQLIKEGPDEETMDEIITQLFSDVTKSKTGAKLITNLVSGDDVLDIYEAIMFRMEYKVTKVEKVKQIGNEDSDGYKVTVHIENINQKLVVGEVAKRLLPELDKIVLSSDKSKQIANMFKEASNNLASQKKVDYLVSGDYEIYVAKKDGNITFVDCDVTFKNGIVKFIFNCAGITY